MRHVSVLFAIGAALLLAAGCRPHGGARKYEIDIHGPTTLCFRAYYISSEGGGQFIGSPPYKTTVVTMSDGRVHYLEVTRTGGSEELRATIREDGKIIYHGKTSDTEPKIVYERE